LSAETKKEARFEVPEWFSTHPSDQARIERALQAAETDRQRATSAAAR
jgi:Zn-dependent protease with chaperone function